MSAAVVDRRHWPRVEQHSQHDTWYWWCTAHGTCSGGYGSRGAARRAADAFCGDWPLDDVVEQQGEG